MKLQEPPNGIEWTRIWGRPGYTWNPVSGCQHGCRWRLPDGSMADCYARTIAEGLASASYPHGFAHHYWHPDRLEEPLQLEEPAGIFAVSMGDLFGPWVSDEEIIAVLDVMREAKQHIFFMLTKNAPRMLKFARLFPRNAWPGVSTPPTHMYGKELTEQQQRRMFSQALDVLEDIFWNPALRELRILLSLEPLSFDAGPMLTGNYDWVIVGAASKGRRTYQPHAKWIRHIHAIAEGDFPVFHRSNLDWPKPRREFPCRNFSCDWK